MNYARIEHFEGISADYSDDAPKGIGDSSNLILTKHEHMMNVVG